jgi:hypothetical protein
VIQSTVTMLAYTQRMNRRRVAIRELADYWPARIERLLGTCVRDRALASRGFDSRFDEFMADPMRTLESVYRVAELELTPGARANLTQYLDAHPRGKEGQVVYRLERDFGLAPSAVRKRFGFYFDRFGVRAEVA